MRKFLLSIVFISAFTQAFSQQIIELRKRTELKLSFQKLEKPVQVFPKIVRRKVESQKFENTYGNLKLSPPIVINLEGKEDNTKNYQVPKKYRSKYTRYEFKPDFVKDFGSMIFKDISHENVNYTDISHGFFSNQISSITQDEFGVMYFASTDKGICKFTGKKIEVFNTNSKLPSNQVNFVLFDTKGRLWVATPLGICYIFKGILYVPEQNEQFFGDTETIVEDKWGNMWFCTRTNGAIKYDGNFFEVYNSATGLTCNNVKNVLVGDNETWFAYDSNGFSRHTSNKIFRYFDNNNILTSALTFLADKENTIWIGFFGRNVLRYNNGLFYEYPFFGNYNERIFDIKENSKGLWFSLYGKGLLNLRNNKYTLYNTESGLAVKNVYRTHIDKNDNIWMAHLTHGISRLGPDLFCSYPSGYFQMSMLNGFIDGSKGGLWVLPDAGNLMKMNEDFMTSYTIKSNLENIWFKHSSAGVFDYKENLWLATEGHGILKISNEESYFHVFDNSNRVSAVKMASDSSIWFGFYNEGVVHYDDNNFFLYTHIKKLQTTDITTIEAVNDNSVWVGTFEKGITIIKGDSVAFLDNFNGLQSNQTNTIFEDRQKRIWIGTNNGISFIDNGIIYSPGLENDLSLKNVNCIVQDSSNRIWAAGTEGALRLEFVGNQRLRFKYFNRTYGLNVNDFEKGGIVTAKGNLFFLANGKMLKYMAENEDEQVLPPRLFIDNLVFRDTTIAEVDTSKTYRLKAGENMEIDFMAIDWGYENTLQYKYLYEKNGVRSPIFELEKQQNIIFSDLPYGKYRVKIIAANINDNEGFLYLKFEVPPFWWQTIFFKIAAFILILLLLLLIYFVRVRSLKLIQKRLEEEVAKKTKELFEENKLKDVLINEINHRVKNNLQTISSLIYFKLKNAKDKAGSDMLNNIRLKIDSMALIHELLYSKENLNNLSLKDFISNLVLNVERIAASEAINPEISFFLDDVKLNVNKFIVLGMLTTEILTNSLKHAFVNCPAPAIKLELFEKNAYIHYRISDNGTGFNQNKVNKNSLGIRLIDIFSRQLNAEFTINSKNGTNYTFKIPIE